MPVRPHYTKAGLIPHQPPRVEPQMTARIWSKTDLFKRLCEQQDVEATVRQARKFFQRYGRWADKRNRETWSKQLAEV